MNLLLLGAPGAGKGTQSELLSKRFKIPIISMGDMLREMIKFDETLALKVKPYMEAGELVPDDIVGDILENRIKKSDCLNGYILDGFPRNVEQARLLDDIGVKIDIVIEIYVQDMLIIKRLIGRRLCENCGEIYHVEYKKSKLEGVCDLCEGKLVVRKDDVRTTVENRLRVFHGVTKPLRDYYMSSGRFFTVNGEDSVEKVNEAIILVLGEKYSDLP